MPEDVGDDVAVGDHDGFVAGVKVLAVSLTHFPTFFPVFFSLGHAVEGTSRCRRAFETESRRGGIRLSMRYKRWIGHSFQLFVSVCFYMYLSERIVAWRAYRCLTYSVDFVVGTAAC